MSDQDPCRDAYNQWLCGLLLDLEAWIGGPFKERWPDIINETRNEKAFHNVDQQLRAEKDMPLAKRALIAADGLREAGNPAYAIAVCDALTRRMATGDMANTTLLGRAMLIKARSLAEQHESAETEFTIAMALLS